MKMKRSIFALVLFLSASLTDAKIQNVCDEVCLQVALVDPTENQKPIKRSPVVIPSISIDDHALYFNTSCDGCTLRLFNEDGDMVVNMIIPEDSSTINLPSFLFGEYEIQIIRGNYCFYGYINL